MGTIDWSSLGFFVGVATFFGLAIYHVVAGYYHYRYYYLRHDEPETWKCQPKRFLTAKLHRISMMSGSANLALGGVVTGILIYGIDQGLPTMLYYDVADYGWFYTLVSIPVLFAVIDAAAYYVHRALHFKPLYARFHKFHHRFVATSPYVATALHPIELLWLQAASLMWIFLVPLHPAVVSVVLVYILIFNIIDHSGVRLVSSLPWQGPSAYHDDHHAHFHVNFGQHLMIWDRMHGTLRRQGRSYGNEVFGGRGTSESGNPTTDEQFFPY
ncbi:MAG: lathosterol oxidase [Candidatus Binatia bacterium]|jgi:lathosterol oxidase